MFFRTLCNPIEHCTYTYVYTQYLNILIMIVAYKIWHDKKHFIHEDTTDQLNVKWTTDRTKAKSFPKYYLASRFFNDLLGFSINESKYDALYVR
jgi:hypothetical protein